MASSNRSPSRRMESKPEGKTSQSVTLREGQIGSFPCPICRKLLSVGRSKRGKPYVQCNDCGAQLFVRGKEGIRRFGVLLGSAETPWDVRDLSTVLDHFAFLKRRLTEIRKGRGSGTSDTDLDLEAGIIDFEIRKLRESLRKQLKRKREQFREMRGKP